MGNKNKIISFLMMAFFLGACAQPAFENIGNDPKTTSSAGEETETTAEARRFCSAKLTTATPARLNGFFALSGDKAVSGLQNDPTFCLGFNDLGDDAEAGLRVEFEDSHGTAGLSFSPEQIVHIDYRQNVMTTGGYRAKHYLRVIFKDAYGLVRFSADSGSSTSDVLVGAIRYYNLPEWEDAMKEAVADFAADCRSGVKTLAECYGYRTGTAKWWEAPVPLTLEEQAVLIFEKKSQPTLSKVEIHIDDADMSFLYSE